MLGNFAQRVKKMFGLYQLPSEEFFEELTEALIEGDISTKIALEVESMLKKECKEKKITNLQ